MAPPHDRIVVVKAAVSRGWRCQARHLRQHETAVVEVLNGKSRVVNARSAVMCSGISRSPRASIVCVSAQSNCSYEIVERMAELAVGALPANRQTHQTNASASSAAVQVVRHGLDAELASGYRCTRLAHRATCWGRQLSCASNAATSASASRITCTPAGASPKYSARKPR